MSNSQSQNLSTSNPEHIKLELKQSIYINAWRAAESRGDVDFALELESAFKAQFNMTLDYDIASEPGFNFGFFGPAGHGKTSTVRSAVKEFCSEMNLNAVDISGLSRDYIPGKRDYFYGNINLGGSYSTSEFAIPQAVKKEGSDDFLDRLGHRIFSISKQGKGTMLLLDDVTNAQPNLIGPLLEITENKTFGSNSLAESATICLTGNLMGDGSVSTLGSMGTPLHSRIKNFYVEDSPTAWVQRWDKSVMASRFSDSAKSYMLGLGALVSRADGHFIKDGRFVNDTVKGAGSVVNPRSLNNFGQKALLLAIKNAKAGVYGSDHTLADVLRSQVTATLGRGHEEFITNFLNSYLEGAQTLAIRALDCHIPSDMSLDNASGDISTLINDVRDSIGVGADAIDFSYKFTTAIANELAIKSLTELRKEAPDFEVITNLSKSFAMAIEPLNASQSAEAVDLLVARMVESIPECYTQFSSAVTTDRRVLQEDVFIAIQRGFLASENKTILVDNKQDTIASLISKHITSDDSILDESEEDNYGLSR